MGEIDDDDELLDANFDSRPFFCEEYILPELEIFDTARKFVVDGV